MMPISAAQCLRRGRIASAANDEILGIRDGPYRAVAGRLLVIGLPGIEAPFPDVAVHVIKAPAGGQLLSGRRIVAGGIVLEPTVLAEILDVVAEGIGGRRPGPAAIFPLRLGRETNQLVLGDELA